VIVPFRNIMASPVVWGTIIIKFCYNCFVFYSMTRMPIYSVDQRHHSLSKIGLYSFFSFSGIAIVAVLAWLGWPTG
jgi:ACS family D-galactonate transporter-like MFS transporter